jgi:hypothetical protein
MKVLRTKLWVGVGLCIAMGGAQAAEPMADHHDHAAASAAAGSEGGEGGESGAAFATLQPDQQLVGGLNVIRGHLMVGRELLNADRVKDAIPHFLHPTEEVYGGLKPELDRRRVGFEEVLLGPSKLARAGAPKAEIAAALDKAEAAIAKAEATVQDRNAPAFVLPVVGGLLRVAAGEYASGFEGDRIISPVEYQDGRGFYAAARALAAAAAPGLKGKGQAGADFQQKLAALAPVWPSLLPPSGPAMAPGEVSALVSRLELSAGKVK